MNNTKMNQLENMVPEKARQLIRSGEWKNPTIKVSLGYVQANLIVLPEKLAFAFLLFCMRNPKPCPILDVTEVGSPNPAFLAPEADLRTDLPQYNVYRQGTLIDETGDVTKYWREDLVAFLVGCRFTLEAALQAEGIEKWEIGQEKAPPNYISNIDTIAAGPFSGPVIVSMRPIKNQDIVTTVEVSKRFPKAHGTPLHIGDSKHIGIDALEKPDFGDSVELKSEETPVFWGCGVTPILAAQKVDSDILITHKPGHMFIGDWAYTDLEEK